MPDYQKMYYTLFNEVTIAITKLQQAQQKTEEMYMASKETVLATLSGGSSGKKQNILQDKRPATTKKKKPSHDER